MNQKYIFAISLALSLLLTSCTSTASILPQNSPASTITSTPSTEVDSTTAPESTVSPTDSLPSAPTVDYDDLTAQEKVVWDFYDTINERENHPDGNWEKRVDLQTPDKWDDNYSLSNNSENRETHVGLFNINGLKIVYINQVETGSADSDLYPDNEVVTYLVGMECSVYEESGFYSNGLNWDFVSLVNIDDSWYIMSIGGPIECWTLEEVIERWGERN